MASSLSGPSRRPPRLHLFDLDGTLIHGSSAAVEISRQLGLDEEIRELELAFAAGGMTPPEFAARACALWSELTEDHITAAFMEAPWLSGIREVWAEIRERGERSAVISLSPDFFVGRLLLQAPPPGRWTTSPAAPDAVPNSTAHTAETARTARTGGGADATYGSRWPAVPFRELPDPSGILSAEAKVRIADELCAEFGVSRSECVAYGDSMSDAALFAAVPVSVAVNADGHVRGLASAEYEGRDLREAYGLVGRNP
ncbi:HAD family hydrolase [Streptomyces winkii]|uniref:HAD family hydrolase n=1 Tax=Streptomyces winkii TaxID=3051178 RepID=UPI0028D23EAC|nr:haloacid dehalogenase-like hydrolase [Streptomyces sp. DSM 40971]